MAVPIQALAFNEKKGSVGSATGASETITTRIMNMQTPQYPQSSQPASLLQWQEKQALVERVRMAQELPKDEFEALLAQMGELQMVSDVEAATGSRENVGLEVNMLREMETLQMQHGEKQIPLSQH